MATVNPTPKLSGLAGRLVGDGLIDAAAARLALEQARQAKLPLIGYLLQSKLLAPAAIAQAAAAEFGLPLLDLAAMEPDPAAIALVNAKLIQRHRALPLFKRGKRLFLAVADPANTEALNEIKFQTGLNPDLVLVEQDKLERALERALDGANQAIANLELDEDLDKLSVGGEEEPAALGDSEADDAPVVRFINKILLDAIHKGASDIHFEPYDKHYRIRLRQDGVLRQVAAPPATLAPRLSARLKVMARLDIAERRVPQDGRIKINLSKTRAIDFRVNTCPTLYGEKIVLRILDPNSLKLGIDQLGYEDEQKRLFLEAVHKPYGMVLVTGPTGSGKTVSLYTALDILNTEDRNISTVEDPVEINLRGINQVSLNLKSGLTFAAALRAFLRQDPDVIMVGEIRDLETAEIAIKAAQTGHLVLSTLHTNDAPQTLTRLANMGIAPYNIASSISLIIAQRLARRLCEHCKQPLPLPAAALLKEGFIGEELEGLTIYQAVGCDRCTGGYKGRVGIYQVMPVTEAMGRIILQGGNAPQLAEQARREGVADLRRSGLAKVRQGVISLAELNRVTME